MLLSIQTSARTVRRFMYRAARGRTVHKAILLTLAVAMLFAAAMIPSQVYAQEADASPLDACLKGAFSTEEDFMMQEGEPYDGDPYISDGDVLSVSGTLCARNRDLLQAFNPAGAYLPDLGLDALDILNIPDRLIAFSTDLDDPEGRFSAGDLLFTNGAVIPNIALVHHFDIDYDIGLDGVQLIGDRDVIREFVSTLHNVPRDVLIREPGRLQELLKEFNIDIWFTVEGTWGDYAHPDILDGDLLSALGVEVAGNDMLLPGTVPAGIVMRGVDFGLDAIQTRPTGDPETALASLQFSTEILFWGSPTFTDGDIMSIGGAMVASNADLVKGFIPAADFLGLDALSYAQPDPDDEIDPMITLVGNQSVWKIDGGIVPIGGPGTGLYADNPGVEPQRPFGSYIPIDGHLPAGIHEFRVAFRKAGDPRPAPGAAPGISTSWRTREWDGTACIDKPIGTYKDDGNGWFAYSEYYQHRYGDIICPDSGIVFAVWDTLGDPNVADKDGKYVLWLEWKNAPAGPIIQEPMDHNVQLDNTAPVITNLEVRTPDGVVVEPCGGADAGTDILHVYAEFSDAHFQGYRITVSGGNPPTSIGYGWHNYWDGTPEVANVNGQGTTPAGLQLLRTIDMNDFGASYTACCYLLNLSVSDRGIRHSFNGFTAYPSQPSWAWPNQFLTFAAAP